MQAQPSVNIQVINAIESKEEVWSCCFGWISNIRIQLFPCNFLLFAFIYLAVVEIIIELFFSTSKQVISSSSVRSLMKALSK